LVGVGRAMLSIRFRLLKCVAESSSRIRRQSFARASEPERHHEQCPVRPICFDSGGSRGIGRCDRSSHLPNRRLCRSVVCRLSREERNKRRNKRKALVTTSARRSCAHSPSTQTRAMRTGQAFDRHGANHSACSISWSGNAVFAMAGRSMALKRRSMR